MQIIRASNLKKEIFLRILFAGDMRDEIWEDNYIFK